MIVKLLTEHHLEFLSLKEGCRGSSESTLVKMPHCWKSHAAAQIPSSEEPVTALSESTGESAHWHSLLDYRISNKISSARPFNIVINATYTHHYIKRKYW